MKLELLEREARRKEKELKYSQYANELVEEERKKKNLNKNPKYKDLPEYEILEKMGEGAFSIVYKARDINTNEYVAVKVIRKYQMDKKQQLLVLKEVTIMRQLNHPNVVRFVKFVDSEEFYFIVQELVSGGEIFSEIVKYTYFSEDLARHVVLQLANAIRYLHKEVGVVHRDIKPENLLFEPIDFVPSKNVRYRKSDDPNTKQDEGEFIYNVGGGGIGTVKLADFGLSKQIWEHNTKTPVGTIGYTAPEIVRDERYSTQVDMWGIGCILYTLLCGFPPFYDERIETLTEKVARGQFQFLQPWWDEISYGAKNCVSRLLTVDPRQRYTIDEFLNDPWILNYIYKCKRYELQTKSQVEQEKSNNEAEPYKPSKAAYELYTPITQKKKNPFNSVKVQNNPSLYSPAAVALRDAFDVSNAVNRKREEEEFLKQTVIPEDIMEEDSDEETGNYTVSNLPKPAELQGGNLFDLNLDGSTILGRRNKKKEIPVVITH